MTNNKDQEKVIEYSPSEGRRKNLMLLLIGLSFVLTWGAMIAGMFYLKDGSADEDDIEVVSQQITEIKQQVTEQKTAIEQLKDLEEVVKQLPDNLPEPDSQESKQQLEGLSERIAKLEEKNVKPLILQEDNTSPLVVSLVSLRDRIQKYLPYQNDMKMLGSLVKGDKFLEMKYEELGEKLSDGYSNIEKLKQEFSSLAGEIVAAEKNDKGGFWNKVTGAFSGAVKIRKTGADNNGADGDGAEAIVAAAEFLLNDGDLRAAIEKLEKLQGDSRKVAEKFLETSKATQKVEDIFEEMYQHVIGSAYDDAEKEAALPATEEKPSGEKE